MSYVRYNRKHPRLYKKNMPEQEEENALTLSAASAVGILALTFAKGIFWGYMIKRRLG
ncbi:MAG: hypothetical protein N3B21_17925 [Clostridia bacterium]|nr:hypothetical protein [Clostridia bacterium]